MHSCGTILVNQPIIMLFCKSLNLCFCVFALMSSLLHEKQFDNAAIYLT